MKLHDHPFLASTVITAIFYTLAIYPNWSPQSEVTIESWAMQALLTVVAGVSLYIFLPENERNNPADLALLSLYCGGFGGFIGFSASSILID